MPNKPANSPKPAPKKPTVDIAIRNEGSIMLFDGKSANGRTWLGENLDPDGQRFGNAYVVEPRYAAPIVEGARNDGLVVE